MKKFYSYAAIAALLSFALISCNKENLPSKEGGNDSDAEFVDLSLAGNMDELQEDGEDSKTHFYYGGGTTGSRTVSTYWDTGKEEVVDFFSIPDTKTVTKVPVLATNKSNKSATFNVHIKKSEGDVYYATYPTGKGTVNTSGVATLTVPATQQPLGSLKYDPSAALMWGKITNGSTKNVSFTMKPVCAYVRINVVNSVWTKIEISSRDESQYVAGKFQVNASGDLVKDGTGKLTVTEGKKYITITPSSSNITSNKYFTGGLTTGDDTDKGKLLVAVLPQNYSKGLRITFYSDTKQNSSQVYIRGLSAIDLRDCKVHANTSQYDDLADAGFKKPYVTGGSYSGTPTTTTYLSYSGYTKTNTTGIRLYRSSSDNIQPAGLFFSDSEPKVKLARDMGNYPYQFSFFLSSHECQESGSPGTIFNKYGSYSSDGGNFTITTGSPYVDGTNTWTPLTFPTTKTSTVSTLYLTKTNGTSNKDWRTELTLYHTFNYNEDSGAIDITAPSTDVVADRGKNDGYIIFRGIKGLRLSNVTVTYSDKRAKSISSSLGIYYIDSEKGEDVLIGEQKSQKAGGETNDWTFIKGSTHNTGKTSKMENIQYEYKITATNKTVGSVIQNGNHAVLQSIKITFVKD